MMNRQILLGLAGLGLVVTLGACAHAADGSDTAGAAVTASSPTTSPSAASAVATSVSTPPPVTASPVTASPAGTPGCAVADLTAASVVSNGAMGHIGYEVTVTNHGDKCRLTKPAAFYRKDGTDVRMPTTPMAAFPDTSLVVDNGKSATMLFFTVNGTAGYPPGAPQCAHPAEYPDVSVAVGAGHLALHGFELDVACEGVQIGGWQVS
jgi:hypothetical protein